MNARLTPKEEIRNIIREKKHAFLASYRELLTSASLISFDSVLSRLAAAGFRSTPVHGKVLLPGSVSNFDFRVDLVSGDLQKGAPAFSLAVAESAAKIISSFDLPPQRGIGLVLTNTHSQEVVAESTEPSFLWDLNPTLPAGSVGFERDRQPEYVDVKIFLTSGDRQRLFDSLGRILSGLPRVFARKLNTLAPVRFVFSDLSNFSSDASCGFTVSGRCFAFDGGSLERVKSLVCQTCEMLSSSNDVDCRVESAAPVVIKRLPNHEIRYIENAARELFESHQILTPEYPSIYAAAAWATPISFGVASHGMETELDKNYQSALLSAIQLLAFACIS